LAPKTGESVVTIDLFRKEDQHDVFRQGQTIFSEGDAGHVMYVVIEGEVELRVNGKVLETLGPGGALGEMSLVDEAPRSASAMAKTDCKLVAIDERRFNFLVQQTPRFAIQVMRVLADRLRRMNGRL
jgi:CRP/FNR family transcriptional regulator, cyclic AMP receptor protein